MRRGAKSLSYSGISFIESCMPPCSSDGEKNVTNHIAKQPARKPTKEEGGWGRTDRTAACWCCVLGLGKWGPRPSRLHASVCFDNLPCLPPMQPHGCLMNFDDHEVVRVLLTLYAILLRRGGLRLRLRLGLRRRRRGERERDCERDQSRLFESLLLSSRRSLLLSSRLSSRRSSRLSSRRSSRLSSRR